MQIRFKLDKDLDAKLIAKILARAGNNRPSLAAKLMLQEWSAIDDKSQTGQVNVSSTSQVGQTGGEFDIDLDSLDDIFE